MSGKENLFPHPSKPFPIGVEYYRGGSPHQDVWEKDFKRIKESGFTIIRSASYWNWMEPAPGKYEMADYDLFFDLAHKNGLSVWLDIMLATHGACPEWLIKKYPDMNTINNFGERIMPHAHPAYPQGGVIHCYDHPAWKKHGGDLLKHVINRYKNHPALHVWGLWDGIALPSMWSEQGNQSPCYCDNSIKKYFNWLKSKFTLNEYNDRTLRKYQDWDHVDVPRSNNNVMEMLLYRQFHYENLAEQLKWMIDETRKLDPIHETRTHGSQPRPWDEICAQYADSWGMSMASNNLLTSNNPYKLAERAFVFDWARCLGKNGRWWNEEIYSGMSKGGVTWKKQTDPKELLTLLWMTLAHGASGAMFWQYRPDYVSFESPGYNLISLDGNPTTRFEAVENAIRQIDGLESHLPLSIPNSEVALVNHQQSHELFSYNDEGDRFLNDLRGTYRTLWENGIPVDIVTPNMDWTHYKLVIMPNLALMTNKVANRISETLKQNLTAALVAEGNFGLYANNGLSSYKPPEHFSETFGVRINDLSRTTNEELEAENHFLETKYGKIQFTSSFGYAVLEPKGKTKVIAHYGKNPIGIQTDDKRFTWYSTTFSEGFGDVGSKDLILGIINENKIQTPLKIEGDKLIRLVRKSKKGGHLVFLFNIERRKAKTVITPNWKYRDIQDKLGNANLNEINQGSIGIEIEPWDLNVLYLK